MGQRRRQRELCRMKKAERRILAILLVIGSSFLVGAIALVASVGQRSNSHQLTEFSPDTDRQHSSEDFAQRRVKDVGPAVRDGCAPGGVWAPTSDEIKELAETTLVGRVGDPRLYITIVRVESITLRIVGVDRRCQATIVVLPDATSLPRPSSGKNVDWLMDASDVVLVVSGVLQNFLIAVVGQEGERVEAWGTSHALILRRGDHWLGARVSLQGGETWLAETPDGVFDPARRGHRSLIFAYRALVLGTP